MNRIESALVMRRGMVAAFSKSLTRTPPFDKNPSWSLQDAMVIISNLDQMVEVMLEEAAALAWAEDIAARSGGYSKESR